MTILDLAFASLRVLGFWAILQAVLGFVYTVSIQSALGWHPETSMAMPATVLRRPVG
jgi:hypothetical protein